MPTISNISGPYRFFFYSFDWNERMHVHVQRVKDDLQILGPTRGFGKESGFCAKRAQRHTGSDLKEQRYNRGGMV